MTSRSRGDIKVNNHLGSLHDKILNCIVKEKYDHDISFEVNNKKKPCQLFIDLSTFNQFEEHECIVKSKNSIRYSSVYGLLPPRSDNIEILIGKDVIPEKLAREARTFVNNILVDPNAKVLDDETNPPLDCAYVEDATKLIKKDEYCKSEEWITEKYTPIFYRYAPKTLDAFYNSPIYDLISILESSLLKYLTSNYPNNYYKVSWVLQLVDKNQYIGIHDDHCPGRMTSFVYYLTSDDYDYKKDGGALVVYDCKHKYEINPEFNTVVM